LGIAVRNEETPGLTRLFTLLAAGHPIEPMFLP